MKNKTEAAQQEAATASAGSEAKGAAEDEAAAETAKKPKAKAPHRKERGEARKTRITQEEHESEKGAYTTVFFDRFTQHSKRQISKNALKEMCP